MFNFKLLNVFNPHFLAAENVASAEYDLWATISDFVISCYWEIVGLVEKAKAYAETIYALIRFIVPDACQAIMIAMVSFAILYLIIGRS